MILVREILVAKPGMASKLANLMKESMGARGDTSRVMTDLTGPFNTVVIETEFNDVAEFEARMKKYREDQSMKTKMSGYTEMYTYGSREIYQVW